MHYDSGTVTQRHHHTEWFVATLQRRRDRFRTAVLVPDHVKPVHTVTARPPGPGRDLVLRLASAPQALGRALSDEAVRGREGRSGITL
ncbi:hypothetical protein INR49_003207 [Caranx melampygus]|nr:hypothetical protein INR49_003207 [Caranx melampygus]